MMLEARAATTIMLVSSMPTHPPATNAPSIHHAETMAFPATAGLRLLYVRHKRRILLGRRPGSFDPDQARE